MNHTELDELYELFVMGSLEPALAAEIEQHLREGCEQCTRGVAEASYLLSLMAGLAEPAEPSAQLRNRILQSVAPAANASPTSAPPIPVTAPIISSKVVPIGRSRRPMFALAALAAACLALAVFSFTTWSDVQSLRSQLASAVSEREQLRTALATATVSQRTQLASLTGERDQLRSALAVIRRPDTRSIRFGTGAAAPRGLVFANANGGLVLVASQLPAVADNRTLELWLVPTAGAPRPVGVFRPTDGNAVQVSNLAINPSQIKAVALSNEPTGGSPAPTTTPFLIVPVGG